jgi:ATP-binding cassette subfamily C protein
MRLAGRVSITGDTGSGKSTICELITGRQAPYGGLVTFMSEADTNPNASVVLVSSQMKLFSRMSVYENLDFGTKDALMENIRQHLRVVEMDSLVDAILYTSKPVSEFGLSRGEEQRLLLARALLLNPGVLVLDEALSGVEMEMFERIMRRMADMVPVIVTVSHRLSDHEGADIVYRVKAGSIAPDGSFAEKA